MIIFQNSAHCIIFGLGGGWSRKGGRGIFGSLLLQRDLKRSLYEGGIRVPGIAEWLGKISPNNEIKVTSFPSDYFPTIAY